MNTLPLILAAAALGVDIGYETTTDGGVESIVQIDPQTLEVLGDEEIVVNLPPEFAPLKRYRIRIGTGPLNREVPALVRKPPAVSGRDPFANRQGAETSPPALPARQFDPPPDENVVQAGFEQPAAPASHPKSLAARSSEPPAASPAAASLADETVAAAPRPWLPLMAALLALCGSLAANFYLGWLLSGQRSRYRELAARFPASPQPPAQGDPAAAG